eukprot:403362207
MDLQPKSLDSFQQALKLYLFEFLGNFIVIILINYSYNSPTFVTGGVLLCSALSGKMTGAHLNFSVTLGLYIMNKEDNKSLRKQLPIYFISGITGGWAGSVFTYFMLGPYYFKVLVPTNPEFSSFHVLFIETFYTMMFLVVVFHCCHHKLTLINDLVIGSICCGIALYFTHTCCAYTSSAVMSPTLAIVNLTYSSYVYETTDFLKFMPSYIISSILGSILAAYFTNFCAKQVRYDGINCSQSEGQDLTYMNFSKNYNLDQSNNHQFNHSYNQFQFSKQFQQEGPDSSFIEYSRQTIPLKHVRSSSSIIRQYGTIEHNLEKERMKKFQGEYVQYC